MINKKIYFLDIKRDSIIKSNQRFNASVKPRTDVWDNFVKYAGENGKLIITKHYFYNSNSFLKHLNNLIIFIQYAIKCFKLKNSIILTQYPFTDPKKMIWMLKNIKKRGNKIIVLIHDLESFRYRNKDKKEEIIFSLADELIVHTEPMKSIIQDMEYKGKIQILNFFDYNLNLQIESEPNPSGNTVIFAGNLEKSSFLKLIDTNKFGNLKMHLYGKKIESIVTNKQIIYKGSFEPDRINDIEGDWGLVWDGESPYTCDGNYGEYLKINAPFKFSLYLAAQKPVIVWSESAMAKYVKEYNLGICVKSLYDIENSLKKLSPEEYNQIIARVKLWSQKVRKGEMFESVLNKIV